MRTISLGRNNGEEVYATVYEEPRRFWINEKKVTLSQLLKHFNIKSLSDLLAILHY